MAKNKFKRLTQEELELIEHLRKYGYVPEKYLVSNDVKFKQLSKKYKNLKIKYDESLMLIEKLNKLNSVFGELLKESDKLGNKIYKYKIKPHNKYKSESVAIAVASDWHIEEKVEPSTVNNLNEYNPKIAKNRIEKFFKKIVDFTEMHRSNTHIDTLILALLGDFITGFIHDEFKESNFMSPLEAIRYLYEHMTKGINYLLEYGNYKKIIIPCAFGNHGRTTKEIRYATAATNSFEQFFYYMLKDLYKENKKIQFIINSSYHKFSPLIFDKYLIRFHHGDAIRYKGGVGGITIPVNKAIAQWNKSTYVYLDVFGHFHQQLDGGNFISNGSLIGYNAYALSIKATFEEPKQTFFLIEKNYGKTVVQPIFLK